VFDSTSSSATRTLIICAALFFLCAIEIAAQGNSPSSPVSPATHEVIDGYGRSVRVPVNPSRIVSLAPSLTETLYALGIEDRLVGDTDYCDYPPDARKKPKVGGVINPNLEQIAALHPDLVLLTKEGNLLDTVRALDTLGIPTYATDARTINQIISSTQKLADVLNASTAGKELTADLQQRLAALQTKLSSVQPRRVLFIVWPDPLISIGKNTFVADAIHRAGAVSIVDSNQDWPQVSLEEIARLQPDYLVFAASHTGSPGNEFEMLANRQGWQILDAVRNRRYAVADDAIIRPAPRIVSVIEDLARQLHPDAFREKLPPEKGVPPANASAPFSFHSHPAALRPILACSLESSCAR
jgi:iron complex transport system substrate-binding protein